MGAVDVFDDARLAELGRFVLSLELLPPGSELALVGARAVQAFLASLTEEEQLALLAPPEGTST